MGIITSLHLVKWIICNSLGKETKRLIQSYSKTSYQIWEILNKSFTKGIEHRKSDLKNKIINLKYNPKDDIHIFIANLENMIEELEKIDSDISDSNKAGILNKPLPENLRFINVFQYKNDWKTCSEYVKNVIPEIIFSNLKEEKNLNEKENKNILSLEHRVFPSKEKRSSVKGNKRRNGRCTYCHKKGHYSSECWLNKRKIKPLNKKFNNSKNHKFNKPIMKKNKKHSQSVYALDKSNIHQNVFSNPFSKDYNSKNCIELNLAELEDKVIQHSNEGENIVSCWILDSGASIHVTYQLSLLKNIRQCNEKIILANGETVTVNQIGDFFGHINNNRIYLKNVYYAPSIKKNLISINSLTRENHKVIFNNFHGIPIAILYDTHGDKIVTTKSNNTNTFMIYITKETIEYEEIPPKTIHPINLCQVSNNTKLNLWHRRLGHFSIKRLKNKLLKINIPISCHICAGSKLRNKPHPLSNWGFGLKITRSTQRA